VTGKAGPHVGHQLFGFIHPIDDRFRATSQRDARIRQGYSTAFPDIELNAQLLLQPCHHFGQGGLRNAQCFSGLRKIQMVRHHQEVPQLLQLHSIAFRL